MCSRSRTNTRSQQQLSAVLSTATSSDQLCRASTLTNHHAQRQLPFWTALSSCCNSKHSLAPVNPVCPTCVIVASAADARAAAVSLAPTRSLTMPLMPLMMVFIRNSAAFLYLNDPLGTLRSYSSRNLQKVEKRTISRIARHLLRQVPS